MIKRIEKHFNNVNVINFNPFQKKNGYVWTSMLFTS